MSATKSTSCSSHTRASIRSGSYIVVLGPNRCFLVGPPLERARFASRSVSGPALFSAKPQRCHAWPPIEWLQRRAGVAVERAQEAYYARLNNADLPRRNALDGRGALSQEGLVEFAQWLLDLCIDQARFPYVLSADHTIWTVNK